MIQIKKPKFSVCDIYALVIYATLIVDLYRKFSAHVIGLPLSATMFRNLVYVALLAALILSEKRVQQYAKLIAIGIGFAALTLISLLVNWDRGATSLYINVMFMFVSRLLPAYYVGTMLVGREEEFVRSVNKLQIFTVLYMLLVLTYPETSETSYLTISYNLLIPSLVGLFGRETGFKGWICKAIGLAGMVAIVVYGGRTSVVSIVLAVGLILFVRLKNDRSWKKFALLLVAVAVVAVLLTQYENIVNSLLASNPDSRTLKLLAEGDFFWSSNRDKYYKAAFDSIVDHPFKFYGFLGDRFYYADTFGTVSDNTLIETMYSHNTMLELLLNFGVIPGLCINLFFVWKALQAVGDLSRRNDHTAWAVFIIIFASAFAPLFLSSSWLNDYTIWLMAGMMLTLAKHTASETLPAVK